MRSKFCTLLAIEGNHRSTTRGVINKKVKLGAVCRRVKRNGTECISTCTQWLVTTVFNPEV
jgi:hypothetical protein